MSLRNTKGGGKDENNLHVLNTVSECNCLESSSTGMLNKKLGKLLKTGSDIWSRNSTVSVRKEIRYQAS